MTTAEEGMVVGGARSRWRRWLLDPVIAVLKQGMSPERVAWTIALGIVVAVFPVVGTTTMLCVAVAGVFRLNQALMQAFNWLLYPVHFALILVFIRMGEWMFNAPPLKLSVSEMLVRFEAGPTKFISDFGMAAVHAACAWLMIAPFAVMLIKLLVTPVVRKMSKKFARRRTADIGV